MGPGTMGWNMGWGRFMMIPFWVLVILGIVALVKWMGAQGGSRAGSPDSPNAILRKRYARGEISQSDFRRIQEDISART